MRIENIDAGVFIKQLEPHERQLILAVTQIQHMLHQQNRELEDVLQRLETNVNTLYDRIQNIEDELQ